MGLMGRSTRSGGSLTPMSGSPVDAARPDVDSNPAETSRSIGDSPDDPASGPDGVSLALRVIVVLAVCAGIAFRFIARSPLWLDEALSANIAALPVGEIPAALRKDGHPPLYYVLLHYWMALVGSGDGATRALSGVFGVASLPLAWIVGRRRGGKPLAWVFLGVLAMSPYAIRYGTEARMYALVSFLVLVGYVLIDDIARRGKSNAVRLVSAAVVSGALLLTHYWAMWLLAAVVLVLGWTWRNSPDQEVRRGASRGGLAICSGGVFLLWWLPTMLFQSAHTGTPWSQPVRPSAALSYMLTDFAAGTGFPDSAVLAVMGGVLFVVGLFGVATGPQSIHLDLRTNPQVRAEGVVLALTLALGLATGFVARSAFASRYAAVLFPLFLLLVATGITRFADRRMQSGVLAVVMLASGLGAYFNANVFTRTQMASLADVIHERGARGDVVVFCPDQLGPSGSRAIGDGFDLVSFPTLESPKFVDWVDYKQRNDSIDSAQVARDVLDRAGPDRSIFVVWSGTYRTFEQRCEQFIAEISRNRPVSATLRDAQPEKYYENATLSWFAPIAVTRP